MRVCDLSILSYVFSFFTHPAGIWQVWFKKLSVLTEVAHDLVPSHIADLLVRNQEAAHQQHQNVISTTPLLKPDQASPKEQSQAASEGKQLESPFISRIRAAALRRSLEVGSDITNRSSYNGGLSSGAGLTPQALLAAESPKRLPMIAKAQGNEAVAAFSHDNVTILFAGQVVLTSKEELVYV